jgi:hypothetical protein
VSDAGDPGIQREYLQILDEEIKKLSAYAARQLRRHRVFRIIVIIAGVAAPVLSSWAKVPREVIGLAGGIAAAAEGIAQLFAFQASATQAMTTGNQLERELNRFVLHAGPYAGEPDFPAFVDRIEQIREAGDSAFAQTWKKAVGTAENPAVAEDPAGRSSANAPRPDPQE